MPEVLDQPITYQAPDEAADSFGGVDLGWTTYLQAWARVRPSTGGERAAGGMINATAVYSFLVRNDALGPLTEAYRILWQGVPYNIRYLPTGTRDRYITILAERGVAL